MILRLETCRRLALALLVLVSGGALADLKAENARLRLMPGDLPAAGYVQLHNTGEQPVVLIGASTPDYGRVMMHQSRQENGMASMIHVASLVLEPDETISFAPGGYHLMLMERQRPLAIGEEVDITFLLEGGEELPISFRAVSPASVTGD